LWRLADKGWQLLRWLDFKLPHVPNQIFPVKFVGVVYVANKRERVRIALRHDLEWDKYYERSKHKPAYWYSLRGMGNKPADKNFFILQIADVIIEWRLGAKGLDRE
jgi:hypothetical protein